MRSETSVTVPSRLNPLIVVWRLNNLTWIVHFVGDLGNGNFGDVNDGKCTLVIGTSVSGGIVSMLQMSRNLSPPRAEPVKRGLPTFSSLLSTVIWVKNCRSKKGLKQRLRGLKCSQSTKKNKKTLKVCTVILMSCLVNTSSDVMWYATQSGHAIYLGSRGIGLEKNLRCSLVFEQNLQF